MTKPTNEPAFPKAGLDPWQSAKSVHTGMSLRDYFAAKVCAAMVSTITTDDGYWRAKAIAESAGFPGLSEWFASDAYKQADAMLAEREKADD